MSDFDDFFDFLPPFSLFFDFGVSGTSVSLAWEKRTSVKNLHRKWHFSLSGLLGPLLENYAFGIRNTHIRCSEPFFFHFFAHVVLDRNHEFYQRRDKISDKIGTEPTGKVTLKSRIAFLDKVYY